MQMIELPASERKWKQQLKEWGFQKNLPARHMVILVAKQEKRLRDYGKDTVFLRSGVEIRAEKFETFKKRKASKLFQASSPSAGMLYIFLLTPYFKLTSENRNTS